MMMMMNADEQRTSCTVFFPLTGVDDTNVAAPVPRIQSNTLLALSVPLSRRRTYDEEEENFHASCSILL
jgi:hypothetical protein